MTSELYLVHFLLYNDHCAKGGRALPTKRNSVLHHLRWGHSNED